MAKMQRLADFGGDSLHCHIQPASRRDMLAFPILATKTPDRS
jgi:hypothetical protein